MRSPQQQHAELRPPARQMQAANPGKTQTSPSVPHRDSVPLARISAPAARTSVLVVNPASLALTRATIIRADHPSIAAPVEPLPAPARA